MVWKKNKYFVLILTCYFSVVTMYQCSKSVDIHLEESSLLTQEPYLSILQPCNSGEVVGELWLEIGMLLCNLEDEMQAKGLATCQDS